MVIHLLRNAFKTPRLGEANHSSHKHSLYSHKGNETHEHKLFFDFVDSFKRADVLVVFQDVFDSMKYFLFNKCQKQATHKGK